MIHLQNQPSRESRREGEMISSPLRAGSAPIFYMERQ